MFESSSLLRLTVKLAILLFPLCAAAQDASPHFQRGPLVVEQQGSFFVGGRDVRSDALSNLPAYAPSGTITVDQMYVRYQVPPRSGTHPSITLIHGCCLTGKTWETTPDGREGWDEYLVRRGYPVYVIDQAWRGRSAGSPVAVNAVKAGQEPAGQLPVVFSAGREAAWTIFRFGPVYPQVFSGMQFPLDAQAEFWKQMVPDWSGSLPTPNPTVPALGALARRLNGTVLVSHSQAGIYPFQAAVLDRSGIAGIVAIEPAACPAATDDMAPFKGMPILVLWGDHVTEFPRWAPRLAACRAFVTAASAAGAKAQLIVLPDLGIHGNSHMMMQDRNNLEVADVMLHWIEQQLPPKQ